MSVHDGLDKLQRSLLDFFFPRRCPFCGRVVGKALLCETCEKELPYSREVRTGTFGRCAAPLYYEGAVREAILSFKFKGRPRRWTASAVSWPGRRRRSSPANSMP